MIELKQIKGIGPSTEKKLNELGIFNVFELFSLIPRKYLDLKAPISIIDTELNQTCIISGRVETVSEVNRFGNKAFSVSFSDNLSNNTNYFKATFYNMPFLHDSIKIGENYRVLTKFTDPGSYTVANPTLEKENKISKLDGIYSIYPLKGIFGQASFKNIINAALESCKQIDFEGYVGQVNYDIFKIFDRIHNPKSIEDANLAIEDLASIDLGIVLEIYRKSNKNTKNERKVFYKINNNIILDYKNALEFNLTQSQILAIDDINNDLSSSKNMSRILCGDVGSGKTAVAFYSMYLSAISNHQSVMMAPTEILANQHFNNFTKIAQKFNISYALLTSSTTKVQRDFILNGLKNGTIKCVFGTQSLFSSDVIYNDLALAIIDEQHRFGVNDRGKLEFKGAFDVLSLTATPIPRSLALSFYENLSVSTIIKREESKTNVYTSIVNNLDLALNTVLALAINGKQGFIVCPAIEDAEGNLLFSIELFKEKYYEKFSKTTVEFIHGKMNQKDKDSVMKKFADGDISILVATSIIEVGIDTKATEMLIINADRFGLASIHQLRGRIGRDGSLSHCILHTNSITDTSKKRLKTIVESNDGQYISEVDFDMRGPGDFIGIKQSGISLTPIFNLNINAKTLNNSKKYADARLTKLSLLDLLKLTHKSQNEVYNFISEIKKVTLNS